MKKSSLYKGCLEPILLRLLKDNGRMYGYQMTQMVKDITKGELNITEGALYPLLHKLEEQGIVEAVTEMNGNRMRKYYSLTKARKQKWRLFFSYFTVPKIALTLCFYAAVLLVGKFLTQDYYQGIFLFALGLAIFVFEIVHSIQTNKLFKSQKKAMIVTSERLSGIIHSGFFVQIFFSSSIFDYAEVKSMHFLSYALISLFMLIIFISILAHRDFIKELYKSAIEQYPKAFA
ncbi:MAG: hypothetical protein B7Y37_07465 [Sphingobacteriia bacterium 28-36-52]|nr:MAG: hypothetical protein B7Y37_07465 [Sphingobacteriia bacterium 28-36-52]